MAKGPKPGTYTPAMKAHLDNIHARMRGSAHPNWKGGINAQTYRAIAFAHHGRACKVCSKTGYLVVHHRDDDRYNSDPANVVPLCMGCHLRVHRSGLQVPT